MATVEYRSLLVDGTGEVLFTAPGLSPDTNEAVASLLTLTRRDYESSTGEELELAAKVDAFQKELNLTVDTLFLKPPFDVNPNWVLDADLPPFLEGDNLLSMLMRASAEPNLLNDPTKNLTHEKIIVFAKTLKGRAVPAEILVDEVNSGPNCPLGIYLHEVFDKDDAQTFDFRAFEALSGIEAPAIEDND